MPSFAEFAVHQCQVLAAEFSYRQRVKFSYRHCSAGSSTSTAAYRLGIQVRGGRTHSAGICRSCVPVTAFNKNADSHCAVDVNQADHYIDCQALQHIWHDDRFRRCV
jgi:hypothetical protein